MSKTARTDGQWQVDCDLNGVPICIGQPLSLPRYNLPTLDEVRAKLGPWGAADVVGRVLPTTTVNPNEINGLRAKSACFCSSAHHGRSCRCGPDGCADSVSCPRSAR